MYIYVCIWIYITIHLWFSPFKFGEIIDHITECYIIDIVFSSDLDVKLVPETHPVLFTGHKTSQLQLIQDTPELRARNRAVVDAVIVLK